MKRNVVVVLLFRKKAAKAFLFLMAHVKVIYKYYEEEAKSNQGTLRNIETSLVVKNIYGWIDLICCGIKPFYTVEKDLDCWYSKLNPIFYKTFMKPLQLGTPGSRGKRKLWDKQKCIGIKKWEKCRFFWNSCWRKIWKRSFGIKVEQKRIWTYELQIPFTNLNPCWAFLQFVGNCVSSASPIFMTSEHLKEQLFLKVNRWFSSPQTVEFAYIQ